VQQLLQQGANIEAKDKYDRTALMIAVIDGKTNVVKLLLDKGANIEAKATAPPYDGDTALIRAFYEGRSEMVKLLLDRGANIEARNKAGDTALITAAGNGHTEIVKLLLDKGANIEAKNNHELTALHWAKVNEKKEVVVLLEQAVSNDPGANFAESFDHFKISHTDESREKLLKVAATLPTPPPIPEEARQLFLQASALIKQTSTAQELIKPLELLINALEIAPWWGNAYYNFSRALELSGQYDEAVKQLNYYLQLKPSEAEASEARAHISVIQAEKEAAVQKKHQNESILAVKYVSGGATRLRYDDTPAWWHSSSGYGISDLYTYWVREEDPFYANVFRMPNGKLLAIILVAQSNNGAYTGDKIFVSDETNSSCRVGREFAFGERSYTEPCGFHYDVSVSNQPNATVTVTYPATGASVTLPIALLYRGRALKADSAGIVHQGGAELKFLHFDASVVNAAWDPNVNAMGLTPTSVTPYQPNKK
jgi:tetratricopeptide (TPR) repeat protein